MEIEWEKEVTSFAGNRVLNKHESRVLSLSHREQSQKEKTELQEKENHQHLHKKVERDIPVTISLFD